MNFNETRKSGTHTEEELNQLTLEEDMGELRRAQWLLLSGHPIQKQAIYANISKLSKFSGFSQLLPLLCEDLVKQDEDIINTATTQYSLIARNLSERDKLTLLHQTFHFIKNYSLKLADSWFDIFEILYCYDMHNSIKLINELTDIDAEPLLKQRGARLLQHIPSIEKIQLLCMDKDPTVRLEIVKTIKNSYVHFTPDKFSAYLQIKISELIYDYDVSVRMAAIEMFFTVQSHLLDREKLIGKLFFEFLSSQNVQIITIMSRICGKVLLEILDLIPDLSKFIKIFKSFAQNSIDDLRINFAYNFPAIQGVIKEFDSLGSLYITLMQFDPCEEVRETLMASVPDILTIIKQRSTLMSVVRKLLEHPIIQNNLYSIVYSLWPSFDQQEQLSQSKILVNELIVDLSRILTKPSYIILEQLLKLHEFFQQCESYLLLSQPLQQLLTADSLQIRTLASHNLAHIAYHDQNYSQMTLLCLNSKVFRMRICYIDFISQTIDICSKKYFSLHNLINVLTLSHDKIFDVRIKLARIMKKIQSVIQENDEPACIMYNQSYTRLARDHLISEILNESQQFSIGDDLIKEQKEHKHLNLARMSADEINDRGSISPFVIAQKYTHNRKRSSITRQPVNRSQPNASFTSKIVQLTKKPEEIGRRTSVPPVPGKIKSTQFKPKIQRLRK